MRCFYLIFLLFICIFPFAAYSQTETQLELKEVSIDKTTQKITLEWYYNIYAADETVKILKCTNSCLNQNNYHEYSQTIMKPDNLVWTDSVPCTTRNFYSIAWRESGKAAPLNNMVLNVDSIKNGCHNSALLSWNPYIYYLEFEWFNQTIRGKMDTIDYSVFHRRKGIDSTFTLLDVVKGSFFTSINPRDSVRYEAKFLKEAEYEFVIQAAPRSSPTTSFSNIVSFTPGYEIATPVHVEITAVSVVDDKYMEIVVNTDYFPTPFQKLYLLKDKPENKASLIFNLIDSADYSADNHYFFTDNEVDPQSGLYYYRAIADNKCKISDTSNILTNIYLYGRRMEKYKDSIAFIREGTPYINTSEYYELFRLVNDQELTVTNTLTLIKNKYFIDVENFMDDGAQITYQIKSESDSYSNTLTIEHEPRILFPNAFYPESVNIENKTFYPIISFPSEDNYLFIIYNRWGQEVYSSILPPVYGNYEDFQGRWDGTFQGKNCPPGIYAFKITYSYNEGSGKYSESGTFMLIR